jgi:hypothetical protein
MGIEYLRGLMKGAADKFTKPNTFEGMEEDIILVSQRIIPPSALQHVETIPTDGISEGTPQEAYERLLEGYSKEQIASEINRKFGHGRSKSQNDFNTQIILDRLSNLHYSPKHED